jgi:hypothetical protein
MTGSFLEEPAVSPQVQELYDEDLSDSGYVWNVALSLSQEVREAVTYGRPVAT